jgi:acyl-CoA thioesterase-1
MRVISYCIVSLILIFNLHVSGQSTNVSPVNVSQAAQPEKGSAESNNNIAAQWAFTPNPKLPNVLIIGDSISMGYTLLVRQQLQGVANVYHPLNEKGAKIGQPANCGPTGRGLTNLDSWLGTTSWQVIVFNFGLHDLEWHDASGAYVPPGTGRQNAPPDVYEKNLRQIVARLQKTGARLIWATTTPVPANSRARAQGDEVVYNKVAAKVMADNHIAIDDLCAAVTPHFPELQHSPNNVHFNDEGYRVLAESVVKSVKAALVVPEK